MKRNVLLVNSIVLSLLNRWFDEIAGGTDLHGN